MVGVASAHLKDVDIFNLLGLDPYELQHQPYQSILGAVRKAYRKVILITHPDKAKVGPEIAQQLNLLKDFLNFNSSHAEILSRVIELVERGCQGWVSTWNPWLHREDPDFRKPIPAYSRRFLRKTPTLPRRRRTASWPSSSPSNPIVLDETRCGAQSPEPSPRKSEKPRRRCRTHADKKAYHPSRSYQWRPAPYADESDIDSVWEQDWDSDDTL